MKNLTGLFSILLCSTFLWLLGCSSTSKTAADKPAGTLYSAGGSKITAWTSTTNPAVALAALGGLSSTSSVPSRLLSGANLTNVVLYSPSIPDNLTLSGTLSASIVNASDITGTAYSLAVGSATNIQPPLAGFPGDVLTKTATGVKFGNIYGTNTTTTTIIFDGTPLKYSDIQVSGAVAFTVTVAATDPMTNYETRVVFIRNSTGSASAVTAASNITTNGTLPYVTTNLSAAIFTFIPGYKSITNMLVNPIN